VGIRAGSRLDAGGTFASVADADVAVAAAHVSRERASDARLGLAERGVRLLRGLACSLQVRPVFLPRRCRVDLDFVEGLACRADGADGLVPLRALLVAGAFGSDNGKPDRPQCFRGFCPES